MEVTFIDVLLSVFSLAILAVPGFIVGKMKLLPEKGSKALTSTLLFIGQPALTFMSFQKTAYSEKIVSNLLLVAGLAILAHAFMILVVIGLFFKKAKVDEKLRVVSFASVFGNCGFMGLPFLQMLFGNGSPEAIMYGAVFVAVFNAFSWTVGIFLITRDKKYIKAKKAILNPPFVALLISLPLYLIMQKPINMIGDEGTFLRLLVEKVFISGNYLGELVTPLSMIILGLRLSEMKLKEIFMNHHAYISSSLKLVLMPALAFGFCTLLRVPELIKWAIFFECCMPTATQTLLFSEQYGNEPHTASSAVLLATVTSVLTIPIMYLLFSFI